jgi:hypothetical protein
MSEYDELKKEVDEFCRKVDDFCELIRKFKPVADRAMSETIDRAILESMGIDYDKVKVKQ